MGSRNGISTEKIRALGDYAKSPLFSDAEKVALEYADAITDLDSALAMDPGNAKTIYSRGRAKLKLGDERGGREDVSAARLLDPALPDID